MERLFRTPTFRISNVSEWCIDLLKKEPEESEEPEDEDADEEESEEDEPEESHDEEESEESEESEEEEKEEDKDDKDAIISKLQKQVDAMLKVISSLQTNPKAVNTDKSKDTDKGSEDEDNEDDNKDTKDVDDWKPFNFVPEDEDEYDELLRNPKKLNNILNDVARKSFQLGRSSVLDEVPKIISSQIKETTTISRKVEQFYNDNEDLVPYKDYIAVIANRVQSEHPDYDIDKLLEEVERETRSTLSISKKDAKQDTSKSKGKKKKPAFAKTTSARKSGNKEKLTKLQKEISELIF